MENRLFELMEKLYGEFASFKKETKEQFSELKNEIKEVKTELKEVKTDLNDVKKTVLHIEQDHGNKLKALFDGYEQHSDKLDRIETEVAKHEEVIIRRVK